MEVNGSEWEWMEVIEDDLKWFRVTRENKLIASKENE